jgi:hypothetical protein
MSTWIVNRKPREHTDLMYDLSARGHAAPSRRGGHRGQPGADTQYTANSLCHAQPGVYPHTFGRPQQHICNQRMIGNSSVCRRVEMRVRRSQVVVVGLVRSQTVQGELGASHIYSPQSIINRHPCALRQLRLFTNQCQHQCRRLGQWRCRANSREKR